LVSVHVDTGGYGDALSDEDCRGVERYLQQKYALGDGK